MAFGAGYDDLRPSSFLRAALMVYLFLIVYASLYPFRGWQYAGAFPLSYIPAPFPRYWTWFDVLTNVAGYIPLGMLTVLALFPTVKNGKAAIFAWLAGSWLSMSMEAIQSFLPSRVPSNVDLLTNSAGSLLGGMLGVAVTPLIFRGNRLQALLHGWLKNPSSRVLIIPLLWPLAQIYPQNYLFGQGQVLPILSKWLSLLLSRPLDLSVAICGGLTLKAEHYWLIETVVTSTALTGAILTLLCMLRRTAPRLPLAVLLLGGALCVKIFACALFFQPANAFVWLTPGAICGLVVGLLMLSGLVFSSSLLQGRVALFMLFVSLIVVNVTPDNPYFIATLQTWSQGQFLNFNGAAYFLTVAWPFVAVWFLLRSIYKRRHTE